MASSIIWFRRDLRLADNAALSAAIRQGEVIPAFVIDPALLNSDRVGAKRLAWLAANLRALDRSLRERGSQLVVRRGEPAAELIKLARETNATNVFFNLDLTPYARKRDQRVALELEQNGITVESFDDMTVHHPEEVVTQTGRPYQVFTAFKKAWLALPKPAADDVEAPPDQMPLPEDLRHRAASLWDCERFRLARPRFADRASRSNLDLVKEDCFVVLRTPRNDASLELPAAGEAAALDRLNDFLEETIYGYGAGRNQLDRTATSFLSPYLRFGALSIRQAYWGAKAAIDLAPVGRDNISPGQVNNLPHHSAEAWLNELIWREFYMALLYHFPHTIEQPLREQFADFEWLDDYAAFIAWCEGRTGYPVVDAALRQLTATGWMHNRARMIVASFLTKDLLIDWRKGERYFMQQLIDGDSASNVGGWQWAAGVGADAQPFFRVFNPTLQGQRFDPAGVFVKQWLPELRGVPIEYVHEPWKLSVSDQREYGVLIGRDYPAPIVDHGFARDRALRHYRHSCNLRLAVNS
jgi:deoxyribodipyrimidine photo-lyase